MHPHECALCGKTFSCDGKGCEGIDVSLCEECDPLDEKPAEPSELENVR